MTREAFYTDFYGLNFSPFHVTPDPDNILLTDGHKHALAAIHYGVVARKGFVVVTGEVGVGKTSVLRASLDRLDPKTSRLVYLYDPRLSTAALYQNILSELTGRAAPTAEDALREVQHTLIDLHAAGINVVLAVDEAQNMPEQTLEDLRVLSNLETRTDKLLQIVLVGQPELDETLQKSSMRQLNQRIAVRAVIPPLGFGQSCRFIRHRLSIGGRMIEAPLFTTAALWYIARASKGIPRQLNIYCDNALINGFGHRAHRINLSIAREALRDLTKSSRRSPLVPATVGVGVAALAVAGFTAARPGWWRSEIGPDTHVASSAAAAPQVALQAPPEIALPSVSSVPSAPPVAPAPTVPAAPVPTPQPAAVPAPTVRPVAAVGPAPGPLPDASAKPLPAVSPMPPPASAADVPEASAQNRPVHHDVELRVRTGDDLTTLCRRVYGHCPPGTLHRLLKANPQVRSVDFIRAGRTLRFPPSDDVASGTR